jgi:hypothetical protein
VDDCPLPPLTFQLGHQVWGLWKERWSHSSLSGGQGQGTAQGQARQKELVRVTLAGTFPSQGLRQRLTVRRLGHRDCKPPPLGWMLSSQGGVTSLQTHVRIELTMQKRTANGSKFCFLSLCLVRAWRSYHRSHKVPACVTSLFKECASPYSRVKLDFLSLECREDSQHTKWLYFKKGAGV